MRLHSVGMCLATTYTTERRVGRYLHGLWQSNQSRVLGNVPAFIAEPPTPPVALPALELEILSTTGSGSAQVLRVPAGLRQKWLRQAAHAADWLDFLKDFDAKHTPDPEALVAVPADEARCLG